jgi:hypothetical protein
MSKQQDYSTLPPLLAKREKFYKACDNLAQSIVDEFEDDDKTLEKDELREHVNDMIDQDIGGSHDAYMEDLLNWYGITNAIINYTDNCGSVNDIPAKFLVAWLLIEAMKEPVLERVQGLLISCPDCHYCKQPKTSDNTRYIKSTTFLNKDACVSCYEASDDGYEWV